jgi:hypothetical protein
VYHIPHALQMLSVRGDLVLERETDDFCSLGYNAVSSVESQPVFRRRNCLLPLSCWFICLAYCSTLKLKLICSSETSVSIQHAIISIAARISYPKYRDICRPRIALSMLTYWGYGGIALSVRTRD